MNLKAAIGNGKRLIALWDQYSIAGYENIYLVRIAQDHRQKLGGLFLPSNNGQYLDMGCGTGNMFELMAVKIRPLRIHAVDWSEEMLKGAELESQRVGQNFDIEFRLHHGDVSKPLAWPNDFFDGVVSNLLICYLTCGWKKPLEEMSRAIKPGGYLYLGTLLKEWGFTSVLWKHAPIEFLRAPITSFRALKYRRIVSKISEELKKHGSVFPTREELVDHLKTLGFEEIKVVSTYWGGGLVLRAKLTQKPLSCLVLSA